MLRLTLAFGLLFSASCTPQGDPAVPADGFSDNFDREQLGDHWHNTGGPYEIRDGWLHVRGARNKPLWLRRVLPRDVRVEFDVKSMSPSGDIKVELFGDGTSRAEQDSYTATSYVVIFGGWNNATNAIARMDEHADDRADGPENPVEVGRVYRMKVERRGNRITAWADDVELATMEDPRPLEGNGHDHFAFNNWQSDLFFDNLVITPL
ncbi:MAG: family 16 glycoside hydrolase [Myxococcota bacterium]